MPLLLYGVTECETNEPRIERGVHGANVQASEVSDLRCLYSQISDLSGRAREAALEFHRVLQAILSSTDVVPFRFPTLLANQEELASEVQRRAAEYHRWLARIRGKVQMEARIEHRGRAGGDVHASGTEYLRSRHARRRALEAAAASLQRAVAGLVDEWRQRESSDRVRGFALIGRDSVTQFRQAIAEAEMASDVVTRISGPWPPTEFFEGDQT